MIKNWFKKKKAECPQDGKFKLLIINDESDLIHEILGISEERAEELLQNVKKSFDENELLHEMMNDVISFCKHENEIVLSMLVFHKLVDLYKSKKAAASMLSKLFGDDE